MSEDQKPNKVEGVDGIKVIEETRVVHTPEEKGKSLEDRIKAGAKIVRVTRGVAIPGAPPKFSYINFVMSDGGDPVQVLFSDALNRCRVIINSLLKVVDGGRDRDWMEQDFYITSETLRELRATLDDQMEKTEGVAMLYGLIDVLDRSLLELHKTWRDRKEGFNGRGRPQANAPDCPDW